MVANEEERLIARGLNPPGPLLLVKKSLPTISSRYLRIIVSSKEAVEELVSFFDEINAPVEMDTVGDDFHVVVDVSGIKDVD
jgi:hypothetical protein